MTLEQLLAEREITRQLIAFARAMDTRDWAMLDAITTADIRAEMGAGEIVGRDALVVFLRSFLDDCGPTQHMLGNIVIDIEGTQATSRAYVRDMHLGRGRSAGQTFSTLGEYHDRWTFVDGVWRMVARFKDNRGHIGSIDVLGPGPG